MNIQNSLLKDENIESITYNGYNIIYRKRDNFVNATIMCQLFNKVVWEWLRYDSTKEYINTLEIELGTNKLTEIGLGSPKNGGGLWIHPSLVVSLARWINNEEFIYWCESEFSNQTRLVA